MNRRLLFDLDNTLTINHEAQFSAARDAAFEELGYPLGEELRRRAQEQNLYIRTLAEIVAPAIVRETREALVQALYAATDRRYDAYLATSAAWRDGAEELLARLAGQPHGIVTGAWPNNIAAMRRRLPELDGIEVLITSQDTQPRQKPDPHGLVLAAQRLDVPLGTCAYVGDHWKDMETARRAGIPGVLLRTDTVTHEALKAATHVIHDLRELLSLKI